jgi:hypothetical protein
MKIEITCCETGHSAMRRILIDTKKFLVFEPAWLWMVRCMSDDGTSEVVWECRDGVYALLCTKVGGKGPGVVSVFPAVVWADGKPEIVEWDKMNPGRGMVKDPFYVMVYNRTDLVEFSNLVLDKLSPVVLLVKAGGRGEPARKVMVEILNKVVGEKRI